MTNTVNGKTTIKPEKEWNTQDFKRAQQNAKAIGLFYDALSECEFNRISACESAKEIWDTLGFIHEDIDSNKDHCCLMAREDSDDDEVSELTYDELYDTYVELLSAFKKFVKKNSILKE